VSFPEQDDGVAIERLEDVVDGREAASGKQVLARPDSRRQAEGNEGGAEPPTLSRHATAGPAYLAPLSSSLGAETKRAPRQGQGQGAVPDAGRRTRCPAGGRRQPGPRRGRGTIGAGMNLDGAIDQHRGFPRARQ
jgi:hypothetical protein